MKIHPVGAEL